MLSNLEWRRQVMHFIGGLLYVILIYFDIIDVYVAGILVVIYFVLSLIMKKYKIPVLYPVLKQFERSKDLKTFPGKGTVLYIVSVFVCLLLFPKEVAMASLIILAIGDSIAPLVGQYGTMKHPFSKKKFLEGSIAGAIAAFVGALFFVPMLEAGFAAIAAMIAEGVGLKIGRHPVDDNLVMPFVAGVVIMVVRALL
ncbi:SEC59/DGK1/VTE5 family protein [Candidatus Woesearchaeota archaeon]|nr:SEC59/DGK1/VTE5 family protein [Candidatus Woesearchaeota archaeon]